MKTDSKIKTRDVLVGIVCGLKENGKKIGFTSGSFDILHAGHVDYLEKARTMCDCLIVGLNTDSSVKRYKGDNRPVNPETHRIKVISGLESVDYVFLFSERRNHENINQLKPDFYFKAGDYKPEQLTSKDIVESYGGQIKLITVEYSTSTTQILEKLGQSNSAAGYREDVTNVGYFEKRPEKSAPAIFLDRDGTINTDISYLHEPEKFELLPGAIEGMKSFRNMGYKIIIVTNQGGIGLGYYTKEDFYRVNRQMMKLLSQHQIMLDKIYFCPHNLSENCECRKPGIALIKRAQHDLNIDMKNSFFIGDSQVDIEAAKNAGLTSILVTNGKDINTTTLRTKPDFSVNNLTDAAKLILEQERK
ncbi:D-glycero-beta-D-manno-heptose 1,7-bisphosphate 7-phosphatase [candidate division KSB1 bacterium]|nr:D-glycero-beta-D-manno-heptose 1,7-bisphosphate 7-phosphatase [candidate division KSB1 bacterium]